jgi:hypothetical protein
LPSGTISAGFKSPDGARKVGVDEEEEDEEDQRERERLRVEMQKLGISGDAVGNQWGSPAQGHKSPMPVPLPLTPSPPTPPTKEQAQQQAEAQAVVQSEDERERKVKAELAEGKASGFTEPRKRPSIRSRASSVASGPLGLGIVDENDASVTMGPSPGDSQQAKNTDSPPKSSPQIIENEEGDMAGWNVSRHLRRLSRTFTSPPVG